jgi:hypothetical protein
VGRGTARVRLGDHRAALVDAEEALRRGGTSALTAYAAARIYAQAAQIASSEVSRTGRDAVVLTNKYLDRATELAQLAVERTPRNDRGTFYRDIFEKDHVLRAIHRRIKPAGGTIPVPARTH